MNIAFAVALCFLLSGSLQAAQHNPTPAPDSSAAPDTQAKIDPAKEADIRRLLDLAGTAALVQQLMSSMEQNMKPVLANSLPQGDYREKLIDLFFEKFHSKFDAKKILDLAVVRYDENFSDSEIKGLIEFYQTPLGNKLITMLPKVTAELQQDGQKLGRDMGRDSMIEVLAEHPDIAKALQEASQNRAPASR
jgi:hypothetical protein